MIDTASEASRRATAIALVTVGLLAVTAAALVLWATPAGPNLTPDGVGYRSTAEHLADGRGLTSSFPASLDPWSPAQVAGLDGRVPFTLEPPGLPLVLAAGLRAGIAAGTTARFANALLLALTVVLSFVLARRVAPRSRAAGAAAVLVAALVVAEQAIAAWHVRVASEPLFLVLALGALTLITESGRSGDPGRPPARGELGRWSMVGAVGCAAAATLTRFVGVAVVLTVATEVVLRTPGGPSDRSTRVRRGLLALGAGLAPAAISVLVARAGAPSAPMRPLALHLPTTARGSGALDAIRDWLPLGSAGVTVRTVVLIAIAAGVAVLAVSARRRRPGPRADAADGAPPSAVRALLTFAAWDTLIVFATAAFVDDALPLDGRMLLPVLTALTIVVVPLAVQAFARVTRHLATAAVLVLAALVAWTAWTTWRPLTEQGVTPVLAYDLSPVTGPATDPAVGAALRALPPGTPIAATTPSKAHVVSGRPILPVPRRTIAATGEPNPRYDAEMGELGELLRAGHGVVVLGQLDLFLSPDGAVIDDLRALRPASEEALGDAVVLRW